jgi:hypothetical protein
MMTKAASLTLLLFSVTAMAQNQKLLSEKVLIESFRKSSVLTKSNEATVAQQRLSTSLVSEQYQARGFTEINVSNSQERAMTQFQPILSPYEDWRLGVEKKLSIGTQVSVETFGKKYSIAGTVSNATQVGAKISGQFDLWKNIFGRLDRAKLESAESQQARAELQLKINQRTTEALLRKTFWSYVATNQSIELTKQLVQSAERQLKDARNRAREGAADRGEVARYAAQVESRNSSLLLFQYEAEVIGQFFEKQLEGFKMADWRLDPKAEKSQVGSIEQCLVSIISHKEPNLDYTSLDEMAGHLDAELDAEEKIAKSHGDIDLALIAQYQTTGIANAYDDARTNLEDNRRGGTAVGLKLSVPLGGDSGRSERALVALKRNSIEAQKMSLKNELRSTHDTMLKSIELLNSGLSRQIENSKSMDISYREMLRKFRQGRVPVTTLVLEQDALFQSQLQEISIKKTISHVLLDYFSVFNSYPCSWNQI